MKTTLFIGISAIPVLLYSFRFGYLLSGYPHGGQLLGLPFGIGLFVLAIASISLREGKVKGVFTTFYFGLFCAIVQYSIVIECIIRIHPDHYNLLYAEGDLSLYLFELIFGGIFLLSIYFAGRRLMKPNSDNE